MKEQHEFVKVIKENEGIIFKITFVYANNNEEQKDLYQEIVYQLWKSYKSFRNESKNKYLVVSNCIEYFHNPFKKGKKKGKSNPN